jgi:hypothetical protein
MTPETAHVILTQAYRHGLSDEAFGDEEVYWTSGSKPDGEIIAFGYRGRSVTVTIRDTRFTGADAEKLMRCGRFGSSHSNNEPV